MKKTICRLNQLARIEFNRRNEFIDKQELETIPSAIKEVYLEVYKMFMWVVTMMVIATEKLLTKNITLYDLGARDAQISVRYTCACSLFSSSASWYLQDSLSWNSFYSGLRGSWLE